MTHGWCLAPWSFALRLFWDPRSTLSDTVSWEQCRKGLGAQMMNSLPGLAFHLGHWDGNTVSGITLTMPFPYYQSLITKDTLVLGRGRMDLQIFHFHLCTLYIPNFLQLLLKQKIRSLLVDFKYHNQLDQGLITNACINFYLMDTNHFFDWSKSLISHSNSYHDASLASWITAAGIKHLLFMEIFWGLQATQYVFSQQHEISPQHLIAMG